MITCTCVNGVSEVCFRLDNGCQVFLTNHVCIDDYPYEVSRILQMLYQNMDLV